MQNKDIQYTRTFTTRAMFAWTCIVICSLAWNIFISRNNTALVWTLMWLIVTHAALLATGILGISFMKRFIIKQIEAESNLQSKISKQETQVQALQDAYDSLNDHYKALTRDAMTYKEKIQELENDLIMSKLELDVSEKKLKTFMTNSPISTIITDFDGIVEYASPLSKRVIGFSDEFLVGKDLFTIVHISDFEKLKKKWFDIRYNQSDIRDFEFKITDHNDQVRWVSLSSSIIENLDGKPVIQNSLYNISHTKAVETELVKARESAEENDKLKSAFLANMSHEIRTPMNGILGFSSRLMKPNLSDEKKEEYVKIINNCGNQLLTLVDDLIDITKIEANQVTIQSKKTNINEIIDELFSILNTKINNPHVSLWTVKGLPDTDSFAETDGVRLRQILTNLVNNALKFTHNGKITFGYKTKENFLEFFVEDTGIGIETSMLSQVFERYKQADMSITQTYGGSGLGLSISKALVELLGGTIYVNSEINKGTTFTFTIPWQTTLTEQTSNTLENPSEERSEKKTAIIAEDDESNFLLLYEFLTDSGFNILRARDGSQAVLFLVENPKTDIIFMDIKMPVMNGCEATKQIRKFDNSVPIIAQTAYIHVFDKEYILEAGCNEILTKPIKAHDIQNIIHKYL